MKYKRGSQVCLLKSLLTTTHFNFLKTVSMPRFLQVLTLFVFLIFPLKSFSQSNYKITGIVKDAKTGEKLPGASIQIPGTSTGAISDLNGRFEISNIQTSKVTISASYISYKTFSTEVEFKNNRPVNLTIQLQEAPNELSEVKIVQTTEGQTKAMLEQKLAVNIKSIISAEQIKQFPDVNAAEVVQRIPGITLQRDQGEGRYIQLRGTPPELTNFNINGEQIPSPEGDVRYVGLDIISADQIEFIEVTKVLTPDMDADGIAGNVNIITKAAGDSIPEITVSLAGGYNDLLQTTNQQLQFSYGQRVKKFGFQLNASYYNNNQGSHNMEYDYSRGPTLSEAQSGDTTLGAQNFHILYEDIEFRHYVINRERIGLSANLDYRINDANLFYLRGMYNKFSDEELRRRMSHRLSDADDPLKYRSTGIDRDIRERTEIQTISTLNVGAEHKIGSLLKLDYEYSYSYAIEDIPDYMFASFDRGLIGITIDKSEPQWPVVQYINEEDSLNAFDYEDYEFDGLSFQKTYIQDINQTAKLNIQIPYEFGNGQYGFIKFGAKVRTKEKFRDKDAKEFSRYYEKLSIYTQTTPPLTLDTITDGFHETNLLKHNYEMTKIPEPGRIRDFYEAYPQNFKYDETETWEESYQGDYEANENVYAAYLMVSHNINKLMVLGGLRYEQTKIDYTTNLAWAEFDTLAGVLVKSKISDSRSVDFLLPQVQLKYSVNQKTNLRAAATYTYSRPNFDAVLPYRKVDEDGDLEKGYPNVGYPVSLNLDLLAETYFSNNGILSGGVFYKSIEDVVFKFVRRAHESTNFNRDGLIEITKPVNGIEASVYGAEIQTQTKFSKLPGMLKDFGFFGTYTYTQSYAIISKRYPQNENDVIYLFDDFTSEFFTDNSVTETIPLPGQAEHTANLALFYEGKKLYVKLSANYHSEFLDELGNDSGLDVYYDRSLHLDFTANYQITKNLNYFIDGVNLTNAPLRYYMGSREYFKQQEFYSWSMRMGFKMKF